MSLKTVFKAMRPHHWTKNLLVFVPLITSHQLLVWPVLSSALLAFVSLCAFASAGYILNDYFDYDSDLVHPIKRERPFASGSLSIFSLILWVVALLIIGILVSVLINQTTMLVLLIYFCLSLLYTLVLKRYLFIDILSLSGFFTMRLIIGHEATGIVYSAWLFAFSMFFFLSLACLKRCSELQRLKQIGHSQVLGRGYFIGDLPMVTGFGVVSGYLSVLVFALYINSANVFMLYNRSYVLWLACPVLLYWISHIWILSHRGQVPEDSIEFMFKDKKNYVLLMILMLILAAAT